MGLGVVLGEARNLVFVRPLNFSSIFNAVKVWFCTSSRGPSVITLMTVDPPNSSESFSSSPSDKSSSVSNTSRVSVVVGIMRRFVLVSNFTTLFPNRKGDDLGFLILFLLFVSPDSLERKLKVSTTFGFL